MAVFTKADRSLLVRIGVNLRAQISNEQAMIDGAPTQEARQRLRKRDLLLRDEHEVADLRKRVEASLAEPTPGVAK